MIADKDRSGWFGASDTDRVIGSTTTKTFRKWWMEKLGFVKNDFSNRSLMAGTYYEHPILDALGFPVEKDKQILIKPLRLRVNLDGNTEDTIYEVKTYKLENGFHVPLKYKRQVWVQMYATGYRKAFIVAYGLQPEDYRNFFHKIDKTRLQLFPIEYNEKWINEVYLPRITYLSECLRKGVYPQ